MEQDSFQKSLLRHTEDFRKILVDAYNIDIEKAFFKTMNELEKRLKKDSNITNISSL